MIQHVDRAVEQFFRRAAALADSAIDISFDAPDSTWGASRTRPTVNVFLWEIVRNPSNLRTGMQQRVNDEGMIQRRPATPVVDLHYLVTAWATEYRDEHQLLGSLLECVLAHGRLPEDVLPEPLAGARCGLSLAPYDKRVPGEFWPALGGRLKPALQVEVSLPIEVFEWRDTATPADSVTAGVGAIERPPPAPATVNPPDLVRRRANGAMVMEPRRERDEGAPEG